MEQRSRVSVLGVPVDVVDMERALDYAAERLANPGPAACIIAVNPEKVYSSRTQAPIRAMIDQAGLLLPDGIGIVLALRLLHGIRTVRVAGADYMQALCARAEQRGWSIFLFGSSDAVNQAAARELRRRHPALRIAGQSHGYVEDAEMPALVERINTSGADILFVALGSPRQEAWMRQHAATLKVRICQGIGGTLDTLAGTVKRAPLAFQRLHLEWFYRLLRQPTRLSRQKVLLLFVRDLLRQWLRQRGRTRPEKPSPPVDPDRTRT